MKKLFALLAALLFALPLLAAAQTAQNQLVSAPYGGFIVATSSSGTSKLSATTTPFFSTFFANVANVNQLCLAGDCKTLWPSGGGGGSSTFGTSSLTAVAPLVYTQSASLAQFSITQAGASTNGYITSTDYNSFNARLSTTTLGLFDKGYFFSTTSADWWGSQKGYATFGYPFPAGATTTKINFSNGITGNVTGNADTATALAANGTNCSAGSAPRGVDASGNAENCTAYLSTAITALGPLNQTQTGATQTLATSSATTISGLTVGLKITATGDTQTFTPTFTGAISSLTTANFSSANVSQWTNDSGYITSASIVPFAFTPQADGNATGTNIIFKGGLLATASTTINAPFHLPLANGQVNINTGLVYSGATTTFSGGAIYSNGNVTVGGLTTSNLASPNVSQFTNDAGYITSAGSGAPYPFTPGTYGTVAVSATTTALQAYKGLISATSTIGTVNATSSLTIASLSGVLKAASGLVSAASNGTDYTLISALTCGAGNFFSAVTAAGVFTCTTPAGTTYTATYPVIVTGSVISLAFGTSTSNTWGGTQTFTNAIAGSITGNAGTATALAANGTNCSGGSFPLGVDASGNSEGCTVATLGTVTSVTGTYPIISSGGATPAISTAFSTTTFNAFNTQNTFTSLFATLSSSTNATTTNLALVGAAANCNTTNALTTNSSGVVGCTAQPQGTVTAVSVATANGFAGNSSGGATPALTLTTSVTGVVKGNGTALSAAANGTDYTLITALTCSAGNHFSQVTAAGVFTCSADTGSGGASYPFTPGTFGALGTSATSTPIQVLSASASFIASSTAWLDNVRTVNSTTTNATTTNLAITGLAGSAGSCLTITAGGSVVTIPCAAAGSTKYASYVVKQAGGGDFTTIQAAVTQAGAVGGGTIFLADSVYNNGATLNTWRGNNTSIWCLQATTTINFTGAGPLFKGQTAASLYDNVGVHGCVINGDGTNNSVVFNGSDISDAQYNDNIIDNIGIALLLNDTQGGATLYNHFERNRISTILNFGVQASSTNETNQNYIRDNLFGCSVNNCVSIHLNNGNGNIITGNSPEPVLGLTGSIGLLIDDNKLATNNGVFSNTIAENYFEGNYINIWIKPSVNTTTGGIKRNKLRDNTVEAAGFKDYMFGTATDTVIALQSWDNNYDGNFGNPLTSFQGPFGIATSSQLRDAAEPAFAFFGISPQPGIAQNQFVIGSSTGTSLLMDNGGNTTFFKTLTAAGNFIISSIAAVFTPATAGQVGIDTTDNQIKYFSSSAVRVLSPVSEASFTYSTTTAWTGTTTLQLGPAIQAQTWANINCYTDAGTLKISALNSGSRTNTASITTTAGNTAFSTNNAFAANAKRSVDIGTPASSPTVITCTVSKTVDPT